MAVNCDNCLRIYQNLASQKTKKGEWVVQVDGGKAYQVLKKDSIEISGGHYSVQHFKYGPFSDMDVFLLKHIRGLERQVWNIGLLCIVLANQKLGRA